jgi:predicted NBD/HSP70 family sugar kinase
VLARDSSRTTEPWSAFPETVRRVGLEVLLHGPLARTELATRLELSTASLSRLTKPLVDAGLVHEVADAGFTGAGRPLQPLDIDSKAQKFVGIKLTDTSIFAAKTDLRANVEASTTEALRSKALRDVVSWIRGAVDHLSEGKPPTAVGVALGGLVKDFSHVTWAPFLGWRDVDLRAILETELGAPVTVANDVDSLVEAENWFGHGRDVENFAVLTIGAGVGCGVVAHNRLLTSPDAGRGLIGHLLLDPSGPPCPDGHRGCANSYLGMNSLIAQASIATGRSLSYEDVMRLAAEGDPIVDSIVGLAAQHLGTLIATIANITLAQRVVLTGEGVRLASAAVARLQTGMLRNRHPDAAPIDLAIVEDDPSLWARGAAAVAIQRTVLGA